MIVEFDSPPSPPSIPPLEIESFVVSTVLPARTWAFTSLVL
jgi:hypothetical protein